MASAIQIQVLSTIANQTIFAEDRLSVGQLKTIVVKQLNWMSIRVLMQTISDLYVDNLIHVPLKDVSLPLGDIRLTRAGNNLLTHKD